MGYIAEQAKKLNLQPIQKPVQEVLESPKAEQPSQFLKGGLISKTADILGASGFVVTGLAEKGLEEIGVLKPTIEGLGIKRGIEQRRSFIDVLKRVGEETGRGGLATGQFEALPSTGRITERGTLINFVKEIPVTAIGLAADIALDPLNAVSKLGFIAKTTKAIGEAGGKAITTLAKRVPAVERIGEAAGRYLVPRGGQSELFKKSDRARLIIEKLTEEKTTKLSTPIIEAPKVIQQRVNQVLRGGITTKQEIAALAQPIRDELDRAGAVTSKVNPELLSEETFKAGKGNYLGFYYTKYVAPTEEVTAQRAGAFGVPRRARIPTAQLQAREDFAKNIREQAEEFFKLKPSEKQAVINKALDPDLPSLGLSEEAIRLLEGRKIISSELNSLLRELPRTKKLNLQTERTIEQMKQEVQNLEKEFQTKFNIFLGEPEAVMRVVPETKKILKVPLELEEMAKKARTFSTAKKYLKSTEGLFEYETGKLERLGFQTRKDFYEAAVGGIKKEPPKIKAEALTEAGLFKIPRQTEKLSQEIAVLTEIEQKSLDDRLFFLKDRIDELKKIKPFVEKDIKRLKDEGIFSLNRIARNVKTALNNKAMTIDDLRLQSSSVRLGNIINQRIRKNLGLITDAGLPSAATLNKVGKAEIRSLFFKELVDKGIASDLPDEIRRFQLPTTPQLGASAGKFVQRGDFDAIMQTMRLPDPMTEWWQKELRYWKTFKTAYNPATTVINDLTNLLLLNPLGSVPAWRIDLYQKTMQEFNKGGELWTRFRKSGGGLGSQAQAELMDKAEVLYRTNKISKTLFPTLQSFHKKVTTFYGNQDTYFKFANFIKGVTEDGLSDAAAMNRANFYLVDYSEMPELIKWMRQSPFGAPFISFTYGVSLPLAKTLLERPDKINNYFKTLRAIQSLGEDVEVDPDNLPDELKQPPYLSLKLPFKDQHGRSQFLDLRRLTPANILEVYANTPFALGQIPVANQFLSNPLIQISAGILTNRNIFTGQDIVPPKSTLGEGAMAYIDYIQKQLLPSLAPGAPVRVKGQIRAGGFSFDKFLSLIQNRPDFAGRERGAITTGLDILTGIKIVPIDEKLIKRLKASDKKKDFEEIRKQIIRVQLSKILTAKEKVKEIQRLQNKIIDLMR